MLNKIKIFTVLAVFSISSLVYAQSASDTLTSLLLNIHTMQADFTQTIKDQNAKRLQQSQGHLSLERPGKFRWEVISPIAQLIIANGARLWVYDPDLEQVTIRAFSKAAGQTPASLLSDQHLTLGKDFIVKQTASVSQIAGLQVFRLTPKDKDNLFAAIQLTFIKNQINEMQMQDRLGHMTIIAFQNVKMGLPLPAALFTFIPPKNIDVIDETKHR